MAEQDGFVVESLVLDLNGLEPVPAYFVRPNDARDPVPAVVFNHAWGQSRRQLLESFHPSVPSCAAEFARRGWAAICIDHWGFGERSGRTESEIFKWMLWTGRVMWGMMVFDSLRAVDYLTERPDVNPGRIATVGISMGATMAWWLAALDERIRVCVDICGMTDFDALIETRGLDLHSIYYYVPRLLNHFTTADINRLIAPRPHLSIAGIYDKITPPAGLARIDEALQATYQELGHPTHWRMSRYHTGHMETAEMRAEWLAFLETYL